MSFQNPKAREIGMLKGEGLTVEEIAERLRVDNLANDIQRGPTRDNERPTPPDIDAQIREERRRRIPEKINNINDIRKAIQALTNVVREMHYSGVEGGNNLKLVTYTASNGHLTFAEFQIDGETNEKGEENGRPTFVYLADSREKAHFTRQKLSTIIYKEDGEDKERKELVYREKEEITLPEDLNDSNSEVLLRVNQNQEATKITLLHKWKKEKKPMVTMRPSRSFPKINE